VWNARAGKQAGMFVKHVVPAVIKPARTLWNEVIGFVFLCMAGLFATQAVRYWVHNDPGKCFIAVIPVLLLGGFGVSSFRRARKISRS
jgi:hypothetical protein